jgi:hypothetical protein
MDFVNNTTGRPERLPSLCLISIIDTQDGTALYQDFASVQYP